MTAFDWLTARPIAHRGLHDAARGIMENTRSAAAAAVSRGFGIECDVQMTADGEAVVFHDFQLDRLTERAGFIADHTAAELASIALRGTPDRPEPLSAFLRRVAGAVPVVVEIKSRFDGDTRLADRTAAVVVAAAPTCVAVKSFDPDIVAYLQSHPALAGKSIPLGIVAEASYDGPGYRHLSPEKRRDLEQFLFFGRVRPDFLSYRASNLPRAGPFLCRSALGLPVLGWTIRSPDEAGRARLWCDQIIFEGFDPAGS